MAQRLRLLDCRTSRLPSVVGLCADNINGIAAFVNSAQQRLLYAKEAGNDGWWGTFAEVVWNVDPASPYITLPRTMARVMYMNWCLEPVSVENQFYEYLSFGNGRMPKIYENSPPGIKQGLTRNNVVTFVDPAVGDFIRVRLSNSADAGKRVLLQGTDTNDRAIYSADGLNQVFGIYVTLASPFATSTVGFNTLVGIQKDVTLGEVLIYGVNMTTGDETLLLTMAPGETTASYRRYYLSEIPDTCCPSSTASGTAQVHGIVKLDLLPVVYDTDYCLIQNLEALIEESASIRYGEMDSMSAKQMSAERHIQAIRLLNGELNHYLGMDQPAVGYKPFGSADLNKRHIGSLI